MKLRKFKMFKMSLWETGRQSTDSRDPQAGCLPPPPPSPPRSPVDFLPGSVLDFTCWRKKNFVFLLIDCSLFLGAGKVQASPRYCGELGWHHQGWISSQNEGIRLHQGEGKFKGGWYKISTVYFPFGPFGTLYLKQFSHWNVDKPLLVSWDGVLVSRGVYVIGVLSNRAIRLKSWHRYKSFFINCLGFHQEACCVEISRHHFLCELFSVQKREFEFVLTFFCCLINYNDLFMENLLFICPNTFALQDPFFTMTKS